MEGVAIVKDILLEKVELYQQNSESALADVENNNN